ncbi:hypothetical protein SMICM17S_13188 [Streptomyces microflavus]
MAVGREVEAVHDGVRADVGTFGGLGVRSKAPQSAHPPRRRARHVLQHAQVVVQEAAGGLRVAVAVLQLDGEPVAGGDDPGVRVVGGVVRLDGGDAVAGVHRGEGVQVQEVLEHEEVVEQGVEPGGPLDLPEPQVLVVHRRDPGRLDGRQVGADRLLGARPRPHGHGVEEYADDVAVPFALPARDGHAEHGVAAAGAGAEEEAERTGQHRVQGDPVDPGGFPEQLRQLGGERVHDRLRQLLTEGRGRSGEQRRSRQARQVLRPEAFPYGGVLGGEGPGVLLEARHGRGGVPRLPRGEGLVRLEQVAQQDLAGPAVPEQQVVAEQQAVTAAGQPHHGQPDQRWLPRVEAALAVPGAQGFDLGVRGELDGADVDPPARLEELDRVSVVVGGEARADDRVARDHVGHRLGQGAGVQAPVEGEPALRDVVPGRARHLGLEEQAALERGDRCRALGRGGGVRDAGQGGEPVAGDRVGDAVGEGEGRVQAAGGVVGPGVDLDGVRAVALAAAGDPQGLRLASPAEVVEEDLGAGGQEGGRLRVEVPEPAVGDVPLLVRLAVGDLTGRGDGVGVRGEPYGGDGGEPADGAGVVVVLLGRDPAVALQVDRQVAGGGLDVGERGAQGAAEQFGEADAEGAGGGARHEVAEVGREYDGGLAQLRGRGRVQRRGLEGGDPVAEAVGRFGGPYGEGFGVLGVRGGRRRQGGPAQGGGQVVQDDQPGHRVDGEVVDGDDQGAGRREPGERDDFSGLGVEPSGGLVRRGRRVGGAGCGDGGLTGGVGAQGPHTVFDVQPQPEGRVRGHDGVRGAPDVGEAGALRDGHRPGLGEPGE